MTREIRIEWEQARIKTEWVQARLRIEEGQAALAAAKGDLQSCRGCSVKWETASEASRKAGTFSGADAVEANALAAAGAVRHMGFEHSLELPES